MRHPAWHYGRNGYYFITICTHQKRPLFETAAYKTIAETTWYRIPTFKAVTTVTIDAYVVMPDHMHGILIIENGYDPNSPRPDKTISGTIGAIIAAYKAAVARKIKPSLTQPLKSIWQRGYYDRIIKNDQELARTRRYIANNPKRRPANRDHLPKLLEHMTFHSH